MSVAQTISRAGIPTTHELTGNPTRPIQWTDDWDSAQDALRYQCTLHDSVGDVSLWWLPYVPRIRVNFPSAIFFALRRNKAKTIDSFLRKTGFTNDAMAHWCSDPPNPHPWDEMFPNWGRAEDGKEANLEEYWTRYYFLCEKYDVPIFETSELNTVEGLQRLFTHLGIDKDPEPFIGHKANVLKTDRRSN